MNKENNESIEKQFSIETHIDEMGYRYLTVTMPDGWEWRAHVGVRDAADFIDGQLVDSDGVATELDLGAADAVNIAGELAGEDAVATVVETWNSGSVYCDVPNVEAQTVSTLYAPVANLDEEVVLEMITRHMLAV